MNLRSFVDVQEFLDYVYRFWIKHCGYFYCRCHSNSDRRMDGHLIQLQELKFEAVSYLEN